MRIKPIDEAEARQYVESERWRSRLAPPNANGCVEWMGTRSSRHYGRVYLPSGWHTATRVHWTAKRGPIPDGGYVCHHCDHRPCVRIEHLFLGSQRDNMRDCAAKGRNWHRGGEENPSARLNEDRVREILHRLAAGEGQNALSREFGVSSSLVNRISLRLNWKNVEPHLTVEQLRPARYAWPESRLGPGWLEEDA